MNVEASYSRYFENFGDFNLALVSSSRLIVMQSRTGITTVSKEVVLIHSWLNVKLSARSGERL